MKPNLLLIPMLLLLPAFSYAQNANCLTGNTFNYPKKIIIKTTLSGDENIYADTIVVDYDSKMRPVRIVENNTEDFVKYSSGIQYRNMIDITLKDGIPQWAVLEGGTVKPEFVYENCNLVAYNFISINPEFSWLHMDYRATIEYDQSKLNSLPFLIQLKGVALQNGALGFNPCSFLYPHNKNLISKITVTSRDPEYSYTEYDEETDEEYKVKVDAGPEEVSAYLFDYSMNSNNQIDKVVVTGESFVAEYMLEY